MNGIRLKVLASVAYVAMIIVNALANILPINGLTTGAVSDSYPNLFAPIGLTFSIWGVIYLLLGIYTISQFIIKTSSQQSSVYKKINWYFTLTSIINVAWIFAWHFRLISLTVVLMLGLLYCLIKIADNFNYQKYSLRDKLLIKVPFGVYFGWITIATIANITTLFVDFNWDGFGLTDVTWMIIILCVGVLISIWRAIKDKNVAYGLVPVWAYFGIWLKHTSPDGFSGQYPLVIITVLICIGILLLANSYLVISRRAI